MFCVGLFLAIQNPLARVVSIGGNAGVVYTDDIASYADDIATAPAAITLTSIMDTIALRDDSAVARIQLSRGTTFAIPSSGH